MPPSAPRVAQGPYSFRVLPSIEAVSDARRRVIAVVRGWDLPLSEGALRDVELLTSELITNAVAHTGAPCAVCARWNGERLRVEVTDSAEDMPAPGHVDLDATEGRGLFLVAALAANWGAAPDPVGKRVWFEVGDANAVTGDERMTALVRAAVPRVCIGVLPVNA